MLFIFISSFIMGCCLHCISVIVEGEDASALNTTLSIANFRPGPIVHSSSYEGWPKKTETNARSREQGRLLGSGKNRCQVTSILQA